MFSKVVLRIVVRWTNTLISFPANAGIVFVQIVCVFLFVFYPFAWVIKCSCEIFFIICFVGNLLYNSPMFFCISYAFFNLFINMLFLCFPNFCNNFIEGSKMWKFRNVFNTTYFGFQSSLITFKKTRPDTRPFQLRTGGQGQICAFLHFSTCADGPTDGPMDGRTDRRMDGRTKPLKELRVCN